MVHNYIHLHMHLHFQFHENSAHFLKTSKKLFKSTILKLGKIKTSLEILVLYLLDMLNFKSLPLIATEI